MTGDSSYTGATLVNTGGLQIGTLGADDQIDDATALILNGGTFIVGNDTAGYSDTLGTLTLNASSVIDLGTFEGPHAINFANSSAITWATNAVFGLLT